MTAISKLLQLYNLKKVIYLNCNMAVALWAMESDVAISPDLQLTLVGDVKNDNPGWSSLGRD